MYAYTQFEFEFELEFEFESVKKTKCSTLISLGVWENIAMRSCQKWLKNSRFLFEVRDPLSVFAPE